MPASLVKAEDFIEREISISCQANDSTTGRVQCTSSISLQGGPYKFDQIVSDSTQKDPGPERAGYSFSFSPSSENVQRVAVTSWAQGDAEEWANMMSRGIYPGTPAKISGTLKLRFIDIGAVKKREAAENARLAQSARDAEIAEALDNQNRQVENEREKILVFCRQRVEADVATALDSINQERLAEKAAAQAAIDSVCKLAEEQADEIARLKALLKKANKKKKSKR